MCTGNDPGCPIHGVAASNARQNAFFRNARREEKAMPRPEPMCVRCGEPIDEDEYAVDAYGRELHDYCADDARTPEEIRAEEVSAMGRKKGPKKY